jgi:predicted alpha/beta-hydrolase family hydrolase
MTELSFQAGSFGQVSALLLRPSAARVLFVLAHGAGAGMRHPFLESVALALADRRIATLRYQFPYMEARRGAPDRAAVLQATVRAAVDQAREVAPDLPLIAGGKSMGGRMTSSAEAMAPLPGVKGLVFLGFPLHAPKQPGIERAAHLTQVALPMLFLQGTRDALASLPLIEEVVAGLGPRATLHIVEGGDHSFAVPKRSGRSGEDVIAELAGAVAGWLDGVV